MRFLIAFFIVTPLIAQENINNEIFLFDIALNENTILLEKGKNISENPGYDNQPSFYSSDTIIYAGTRNGQTDIAGLRLSNTKKFWLSDTKMGSEYSPQQIPGSRDVAAVRLDTTGLQLLYRYNEKAGKSQILLPDLKVGYFFFYNEDTLITAVLSGTGMDLVINNPDLGSSEIIYKNIGRSIHKVPQTNYISYTIRNEQNDMDLYLLDLKKEEPESFFLSTLPPGVQDYAWLDENRIILGKGTEIFIYDMMGKNEWTPIADLAQYGLKNITRIGINEAGTRLALAAEID